MGQNGASGRVDIRITMICGSKARAVSQTKMRIVKFRSRYGERGFPFRGSLSQAKAQSLLLELVSAS